MDGKLMEVGFGLSNIIFNALIERIEVLKSTHFVFVLSNGMSVENKRIK
jgi:hypothetical protein